MDHKNKDAPSHESSQKPSNVSQLLARAGAKMASATFLSRFLGLMREQFVAALFGAQGVTDAFLVAYRIPNLFRDLLAEGAFSAAFVPRFTEASQSSFQKAREVLWSSFILLFMITGGISLLISLFSDQLVALFAPSFIEDADKFESCSSMLKIMSFYLCFVSLAALMMGALNTLRVFFVPALAPAIFNAVLIGTMVTALFSAPRGPWDIEDLAWATLFAGLAQFVMQLPFVIKKGFSPLWPKKIWSQETRSILKKLGPGLIGFAAIQINQLVNTLLATASGVGAVSWLSFAFRLFQFPVGILGVSVANAGLVHFSSFWKQGEEKKAWKTLDSACQLGLLSSFLAAVFMWPLSEHIVRLIFERGAWTAKDTVIVSHLLQIYLLGLPLYMLSKILVPVFYTLDLEKIPVRCSLFAVAFNVIFCWSLVPHYGVSVLALGMSLSMLLNVGAQIFFLVNKLNVDIKIFLNSFFFKLLASSLLISSVTPHLINLLSVPETLLGQLFQLLTIQGLMALIFFTILLILGEKERLKSFWKRQN